MVNIWQTFPMCFLSILNKISLKFLPEGPVDLKSLWGFTLHNQQTVTWTNGDNALWHHNASELKITENHSEQFATPCGFTSPQQVNSARTSVWVDLQLHLFGIIYERDYEKYRLPLQYSNRLSICYWDSNFHPIHCWHLSEKCPIPDQCRAWHWTIVVSLGSCWCHLALLVGVDDASPHGVWDVGQWVSFVGVRMAGDWY